MTHQGAFDRQVRQAFVRLHDVPFLQTHPLGHLRGRLLQEALLDALRDLGTARAADLLRLRYGEGLSTREAAERLGISLGEYYRVHTHAVQAVARLLRPRVLRPRSVSVPPSRPLHRPTSFIGRRRELQELRSIVPEALLVTLTGPGGSGKTRLALEIARHLADSFLDGVVLVELAPLADPALVTDAIAAALDLRDDADEPAGEIVVRALRERRVLLVLDNCEHLLDACCALVSRLLAECPNVRILATSRSSLGVYGEREYAVQSLGPEEAASLFVDRVRQVRATYAPDDGELEVIGEICRRVDRLPLGVELAAARIKLLPPPALLTQLCARGGAPSLDLLGGGPRDAHARQRTLRATVDWSYRLLPEDHRAFFRRLSVFEGSFSPVAAGAVAGLDGARLWDGLGALVESNLLATADQRGEELRFAMLFTIREHAREQLVAADEAPNCEHRHAAYYAVFTEQVRAGLRGPDQLRWIGRVEQELDNVRAALRWALREGEVDVAMGLVGNLAYFWSTRGRGREGLEWVRLTLAMPGADAPTLTRARVLAALETLERYQASRKAAEHLADEALALAEQHGDTVLAATLRVSKGLKLLGRKRPAEAWGELEAGLALARASGDAGTLGWALHVLGRAALGEMDYAASAPFFEEALAASRAVGDRWLTMTVLSQLGHVAHGCMDLARARRLFEEGLALARDLGDPEQTAQLLHNLGTVTSDVGDQSEARRMLREALGLFRRIGYAFGVAIVIDALAGVAAAEGNATAALRLAGAGAALRRKVGSGYWPHDQARLDRRLAPAIDSLPDSRVDALLSLGETLGEDEAVGEALTL